MNRGWRIAWLLPMLALSACVAYVPRPLQITDQAAYSSDLVFCQRAAASNKPSLDFGDVGVATVNGAAQNASDAVINPFVPVVGAGGGLVSGLANAFDLLGHTERNIFKHCLHDRLNSDHAAIVADPDD